MFVTALVDLPAFGPDAARRLSQAAGLSLRQAADCLQVPLRGPVVAGHHPERAAAEAQQAALEAAGFHPLVVGPPWLPAVQAQQVVVVGDSLVVMLEAGERLVIQGDEVQLLVWGTRVLPPGAVVEQVPRVPGERPSGRRRTPTEHREGLLRLFLRTGPVVRIDAGVVAGLDDHAFTLLVRAVRRACSGALLDDRLLARRTQEQILGVDLKPEVHLDLAVVLVALARGWRHHPGG